jgi:tetratricopeptide (TPR) repeat protein
MKNLHGSSFGLRRNVRLIAWVAFAVVGAWLAAAGGRAWAMQLSPQQKQEMRVHYDRATRAYDVGKYAEAIEEYQKAYEIGGDPAMLYNIGQAYRLNDQPNDAIRFYRRYLQRQPNAHNRDYVERKIADLEKIVEERRKDTPAVTPPPTPSAPPPTPAVTTPPVPPPPPTPRLLMEPPPDTSPQPPSPPEEPPPSRRAFKITGWSLVGAGVLAGGAAGYFGYVAQQKADKISMYAMSNPPIVFEQGIANIEQNGKNANLAAIVLASASGAFLITGAILLIVGRTPPPAAAGETQTAHVSVVPWIGAGAGVVGAGAHLRF